MTARALALLVLTCAAAHAQTPRPVPPAVVAQVERLQRRSLDAASPDSARAYASEAIRVARAAGYLRGLVEGLSTLWALATYFTGASGVRPPLCRGGRNGPPRG